MAGLRKDRGSAALTIFLRATGKNDAEECLRCRTDNENARKNLSPIEKAGPIKAKAAPGDGFVTPSTHGG